MAGWYVGIWLGRPDKNNPHRTCIPESFRLSCMNVRDLSVCVERKSPMTVTRSAPGEVLRNDYQKSVAAYWNKEKDPVNLRLGDVDGLYHHHYGIGEVDRSVLEGPAETRDERIIAEMHRLETAQAEVLLDHLGDGRARRPAARRRLRARRQQHHGQRAVRLPGGRGVDLGAAGRVRQRAGGPARRRRQGALPLPQHARHRVRDRCVPGHLEQREHDVRRPVRPVRRALAAAGVRRPIRHHHRLLQRRHRRPVQGGRPDRPALHVQHPPAQRRTSGR